MAMTPAEFMERAGALRGDERDIEARNRRIAESLARSQVIANTIETEQAITQE